MTDPRTTNDARSAFGRYVATEDDLGRVIAGAADAISLLRSRSIDLFSVPRPAEARPARLQWVGADDADLIVTLSLDWAYAIAHVDAFAPDRELCGTVLQAFDATTAYGALDDHLAQLAAGWSERQLVRVALAAVEREHDATTEAVLRAALHASDLASRRAATYATRVLGWPSLVAALRRAEETERDVGLREAMSAVLARAGGARAQG